MDEPVMTNEELNAWRLIGADMGLEFDELGHPYKPGQVRDQTTLEFYSGAYDWRPLEDDGDAFRLMLHYGLSHKVTPEFVYVWKDYGKAITGVPLMCMDDLAQALRQAIFQAAAYLVRMQLMESEDPRKAEALRDMARHGNGPWD
jgi:hypothetical protein